MFFLGGHPGDAGSTGDSLKCASLPPVNYSTNTTDQTQQQMDDVLDTFGVLINAVVADFKGLASSYVTQVRTDLAAASAMAQGIKVQPPSLARHGWGCGAHF